MICIALYQEDSQTVSKDHLYIRPPASKDHILHVIEPAHIDHLCIRTTFCWSLGWSLYTSFAV